MNKCFTEDCINVPVAEYCNECLGIKSDVNSEIENAFKYHSPKQGQQNKYVAIREKAKELAYLIDRTCPKSREKSLAITKIEEASMWANASIARNE